MSARATKRRLSGAIPIDADHLCRQDNKAAANPLGHYLRYGLERELDPTPWFMTAWYAWQNPDWVKCATPYQHYLEVGQFEGRDPSPFVDVTRYVEVSGAKPGQVYDLILGGHRALALGVYETSGDLKRCQSNFLGTIEVVAHRVRPLSAPRRALVVLQAGRNAMSRCWYDDGAREWDLLVNYYDAAGFQPGLGDYVLFQKGTKFTAMWRLWQSFRHILLQYDHVLFLDDDIETSCQALNRLFATCREHDLSLAQMSLSERSSCNWPQLFSRPGLKGPRGISGVEIMMPVFSRQALEKVAPTFGRSISGYGLDLAWGRIVGADGGRIAVLDDVVATHERAVDHGGGAFYTYLRRHLINPKAELWTLAKDYDAALTLSSD